MPNASFASGKGVTFAFCKGANRRWGMGSLSYLQQLKSLRCLALVWNNTEVPKRGCSGAGPGTLSGPRQRLAPTDLNNSIVT